MLQFRKGGLIKGQDQVVGEARDEYNWPYCINGEGHFIRKLNLAQVIPKNELLELAHKLHHLRHQFGLNQFCHKSEQFAEAYSLHKMKEINRDQVSFYSIFFAIICNCLIFLQFYFSYLLLSFFAISVSDQYQPHFNDWEKFHDLQV